MSCCRVGSATTWAATVGLWLLWATTAVSAPPPAETEQDPVEASTEAATADKADKTAEVRTMRSVKLPAFGVTQPWVRFTTYSEWFNQNYDGLEYNDNFVTLVNRLNVGADSRFKRWTFSTMARMDTQNIFDLGGGEGLCRGDPDGCPYGNDARVERFMLRADLRKVKFTAGDFNANLGRGLGLSVRKIDEIGVDATIKGGRFDVRTKYINVTALGGVANRQNSDFATRQLVADPGYAATRCESHPAIAQDDVGNRAWSTCSDLVTGGRLEAKLPGAVRVGAHHTYIGFGESSSTAYDEELHLVGGDIGRARIAKTWDLFVGGTSLLRNPRLRAEPDLADAAYGGFATYVSNVITLGQTTAVIEGKLYKDYLAALQPTQLQYTEAPSLERNDQAVPGNANAGGGRVRVDRLWRDLGLTVYGNIVAYMFTENIGESVYDTGAPGEDPREVATHPYAGVIWRKPHSSLSVQASGGYRYEWHLEEVNAGEGRLRRKFPHGEFYVTVPAGTAGGFRHSLGLSGNARWETKQVSGANDNRFTIGNVILGYNMAPYLSVSLIGGFSTEERAPSGEISLQQKPACPIGPNGRPINCGKPHLWPGAEVRVNFFGNSFLRFFGGRQVGGQVCVNGSCRTLPDFEGVRGEVVLGF